MKDRRGKRGPDKKPRKQKTSKYPDGKGFKDFHKAWTAWLPNQMYQELYKMVNVNGIPKRDIIKKGMEFYFKACLEK